MAGWTECVMLVYCQFVYLHTDGNGDVMCMLEDSGANCGLESWT